MNEAGREATYADNGIGTSDSYLRVDCLKFASALPGLSDPKLVVEAAELYYKFVAGKEK